MHNIIILVHWIDQMPHYRSVSLLSNRDLQCQKNRPPKCLSNHPDRLQRHLQQGIQMCLKPRQGAAPQWWSRVVAKALAVRRPWNLRRLAKSSHHGKVGRWSCREINAILMRVFARTNAKCYIYGTVTTFGFIVNDVKILVHRVVWNDSGAVSAAEVWFLLADGWWKSSKRSSSKICQGIQ